MMADVFSLSLVIEEMLLPMESPVEVEAWIEMSRDRAVFPDRFYTHIPLMVSCFVKTF